ncbi:MAG: DUF2127 domain-containing protein [Minisyncoccia bacterium]|jgi:uncharacterized membrane protein
MFLRESYWHELFETGVLLKAFNSAWEITGGFLLLANVRGWFPHLFVLLTRAVFLGGHGGLVLNIVNAHVHNLAPGTQLFVAAYLLFHGMMNLFLSYNLYKNHLWAYSFTAVFTSTFLIYQVYRLAHTHSLVLFIVSILDFIFIILTWHEYKHQLAKATRHASHA